MQNSRRIPWQNLIGHILFWGAYIGYQAVSYGWEDTDQLTFTLAPGIVAVSVPVTILLTYANLYGLMPAFYDKKKYGPYILGLLTLLLAGGVMVRFCAYAFLLPWEKMHDPVRYQLENKQFWIPVRILRLSLDAVPVMALTMLIKGMRDAWYQEKQLRETQQQRFAAEMSLLKAQVNPHFFFNTLNSLYALTLKASPEAPTTVLRLSSLMHYMLYDAGAERVLLADELRHLENYMGIEQMRYADRLQLTVHRTGDPTGKMIAPLLLLPFIENAFKHGVEEGEGWISIEIKILDTGLYLGVENSCPTQPKASGHGLGLTNVRRRLQLLYADRHLLSVARENNIFKAGLTLQL